jgi:hypothetical protein
VILTEPKGRLYFREVCFPHRWLPNAYSVDKYLVYLCLCFKSQILAAPAQYTTKLLKIHILRFLSFFLSFAVPIFTCKIKLLLRWVKTSVKFMIYNVKNKGSSSNWNLGE